MQKYFSNSFDINKKKNAFQNDRWSINKQEYDGEDEVDLEGDDFFFPKQDSPKKKQKKQPKRTSDGSPKDRAIDLMCQSLQTQRYGSSAESFASSICSTCTDTSGGADSNDENDMAGGVIGNLLSTSTMSSSTSWKREGSFLESYMNKTKNSLSPPNEHRLAKSVPTTSVNKKNKKPDLAIVAGSEKQKKKWFNKFDSDESESDSDASALDASPIPKADNPSQFTLEIPNSRSIEPPSDSTSEPPPFTPASAPKSSIDVLFDSFTPSDTSEPSTISIPAHPTPSTDKSEKQYKQSALTIFLLQHVCRQYNPDPEFFEKISRQLFEKGYLDDERFLNWEHLKMACKTVMVDVIKNWPINMENGISDVDRRSHLKRSESVGSFMHGLTKSTYNQRSAQPESSCVAYTENQLTNRLPFFDYMFYSPSRYKSDFLSKQVIGKGAFGAVFRARHRIDGNEYAIKKVKFSFRNASELERAYKRVVREVQSLAALDHQNIVRYNQAWFEPCRKGTNDSNELPLADEDQTRSEFTTMSQNASSQGLQFDYEERSRKSNDEHNITFESFYPSKEGQIVTDDVFNKRHSFGLRTENSELGNELPPSPVNMSYLEYALKNNQAAPKSPREEDREAKWRTEVRTLFDEMFNEENRKFEMLLFIQMQLCQRTTLEDWLWSEERVQHRKVDLVAATSYFRQIVEALVHIHEKQLIHRDLKPPNIFLSSDGVVKIGDFGLAKFINETIGKQQQKDEQMAVALVDNAKRSASKSSSHTSGVGTYLYASPEQLADSHYDTRSDIFSLGIILFEMLHPVATKSERAHLLSDLRRGMIPEHMRRMYPKQMDLIKRCINDKCAARPTAKEVLNAVDDFDEIRNAKADVTNEKAQMQEQIRAQQEMILKLQQELAALRQINNK
jgi:serine/threonine protein kinase